MYTQTPGHVFLGEQGEVIITTNYSYVKLILNSEDMLRLTESSPDPEAVTGQLSALLITATMAPWEGGLPVGRRSPLWEGVLPVGRRSPHGKAVSPWEGGLPVGRRSPHGKAVSPWEGGLPFPLGKVVSPWEGGLPFPLGKAASPWERGLAMGRRSPHGKASPRGKAVSPWEGGLPVGRWSPCGKVVSPTAAGPGIAPRCPRSAHGGGWPARRPVVQDQCQDQLSVCSTGSVSGPAVCL